MVGVYNLGVSKETSVTSEIRFDRAHTHTHTNTHTHTHTAAWCPNHNYADGEKVSG